MYPLTNLYHRYINIAVRGSFGIEGIEGGVKRQSGVKHVKSYHLGVAARQNYRPDFPRQDQND